MLPDDKHSAENDRAPVLREMTVGDLIEQLQQYPAHHFVSPFVNDMLGAGIDLWQMHSPETNEPIVVFGEQPTGTPPIVPPEWGAGPSTPTGKGGAA